MFVSIIVPVFNAEQYLKDCLDSVVSRKFSDYELLLVDDCSSDSSASICREYESKFPQVHYIQRSENGGVGATRNTGLDNANGEYVTFLDNDDYWIGDNPLQALSDFVNLKGNPDIVTFQTCDYWSGSGTLSKPSAPKGAGDDFDGCKSQREINRYLIDSRLYCSAVWSKLIRRDYIEKLQLRFPVGRRNEDSYFSLGLLYGLPSITFFDNAFYVWRRASANSQSARQIRLSDVRDLYLLLNAHEDCVASRSLDSEAIQEANAFASYLYVILLSYINFFDGNEIDDIKARCFSMKGLLRYGNIGRVKLVRFVSTVIGVKSTAALLGIAMAREKKHVVSR